MVLHGSLSGGGAKNLECDNNGFLKINCMALATNGSIQQIGTDNNNNVKCNVVNALQFYPHGSVNALGSPSVALHSFSKMSYENQTLGNGSLLVYGGTSDAIDLSNHRSVSITINMTATGGLSSTQNLRTDFSFDNTSWVLGDNIITVNERPGSSGTYQAVITIPNRGFKYVRLFAVGVNGSPTNYVIKYNRFN